MVRWSGTGKLQQLGQRRGSGPMHGRAHEHLDGFQIHMSRLAYAGKDSVQQLLYFPREFQLDGVRRFFLFTE